MFYAIKVSIYFFNPKGHFYIPCGTCVCNMKYIHHGFPRSAPETKCGQKSGILQLIMADGRPFKNVKFHKTQKPHLHPLDDDVRVGWLDTAGYW